MHIYKSSTMIKLKDGFSGERALVLPQSIVQEMEKDALSSILHITDIGYYPKALHHFRERKEPICQFVFIYCIEGVLLTKFFHIFDYRFGSISSAR